MNLPLSMSDPLLADRAPRSTVVPNLCALRMSMNQTTTLPWSFDEDLDAYERAGIGAVGVSRRKLDEFGVERGIERLRDSRLEVSSLGWVGGFTGANGYSMKEAVQEARAAIDVAHAMGASCLTVVSGGLAGHIHSHARRLLYESLSRLVDKADAQGVRLALQPMHRLFARDWSFLSTLDETLELLNRLNHPAVGLAFGTYHFWEEPRLLERIPEVAVRTSLVQLSDWRSPTRCHNDRALPGDGCIPIGEIMSAFEACRYAGWYEIEVWSRDLWKRPGTDLMAECRERFAALWPR